MRSWATSGPFLLTLSLVMFMIAMALATKIGGVW
jgi:hypothetical protein